MNLSRRSFLAANGAAIGASLLPGRLLAAVEARTPAVPRLDDWTSVRRQFRLSPQYLHFAGFFIASHPEPVRAAIDGFRLAIDENPFLVVDQGMFESESQNLQSKVCNDVAAYLGGRPDEIALTPNTTTGLALVYHGLPLKPGHEVLVTTHDHYSHHESIRLSTERNGASVRKIALFDEAANASVDGIVGRIREAIRPATRVLGITWYTPALVSACPCARSPRHCRTSTANAIKRIGCCWSWTGCMGSGRSTRRSLRWVATSSAPARTSGCLGRGARASSGLGRRIGPASSR